MGINGLLPALRSIQKTRRFEDYSGKTVAVDAYVWLHKGVYGCATELALGKPTHKYVIYAMERVRALRHYNIEPYIVFDGGPLPAKKGTEQERKQKRDEYLARGKAHHRQGRASEARDCFVKCVDVTPQMAFQLIKALQAENVKYVVAPYEADAQLAYLERTSIVDAILTEDSDLLVFGCKEVLFKLDINACTVVSISRSDFGSVASTSKEPSAISLFGWSDAQFRAMAMLSGCDYLPSIHGVGLKTANALLRKWKTVEHAIKALARDGKKTIPFGYLKQFQLAEKCFLHQRVYCPQAQKLVHLTPVGDDWNAEFDAYVGGDLDPVLARDIARGDADPETYTKMKDINPGYTPIALKKPLKMVSNAPAISANSKGKMRETLAPTPNIRPHSTGGIKAFFGQNPIIPPRSPKHKAPIPVPQVVAKPNLTGKASGKRTLAEVMDQDMEQKKKARQSYSPLRGGAHSKFFSAGGVQRRHSDGVAGPSTSKLYEREKENFPPLDDHDDVDDYEDVSDGSIYVNFDKGAHDMDLDPDDFPDVVEQEDGYISPSPSYSKDVQDLSSPPQPGHPRKSRKQRWRDGDAELPGQSGVLPSDDDEEDDTSFGADIISSPVSIKRPMVFDRRRPLRTPPRYSLGKDKNGTILVAATPTPTNKMQEKQKKNGIYPDIASIPSPTLFRGPDLRSMLNEDSTTELELLQEQDALDTPDISGSASPPSPSPETPDTVSSAQNPVKIVIDVDELDDFVDEDQQLVGEAQKRTQIISDAWREKWSLTSTTGNLKTKTGLVPGARPMHLRRDEVNVTPAGRHSLAKARGKAQTPLSAPPRFGSGFDSISAPRGSSSKGTTAAGKATRHRLFVDGIKQSNRTGAGGSGTSKRGALTTVGGGDTTKGKARQVVDLTMSDDLVEDEVVILSCPKKAKPLPSLLSDEQVEILESAQLRLGRFR